MNQESYQYTADQLKNLGFGEEIAKALHVKMDQNLTEFTLNHRREFGKDVMESVLYFSKGDDVAKDLTFFNRYDSTLKKEGMEDLTQTFFVGQKYNYTLQERYNMMDGRAVYREQPVMEKQLVDGKEKMVPTGDTYFAWRSLNFKEADQYGNFNPKTIFWDHEKELQKYPIKDIEEKYDRSRIMRPLEKGNIVQVTLVRDGQGIPANAVANPRMMRLEFHDAAGQTLTVGKKQSVNQSQKTVMTPQEVQRAAMAQGAGRSTVKAHSAEASFNATEQKQGAGQKRRPGARI
ncbi:hypothetical protein FPZ42_07270 [Mucilaginibacter achroorhodeus]|uniref:DUF3945 domain-containing protein n=1 Tax=Mucilaginibacter achroorhodeus TaxID=2599294 RepID=A0A563U650_9SPHI|nr:hypothetical protein [Mucilaginibacter achroorhodeus]TWR26830.1 hypothetical protein FPZ42_07270 [Mucilaginibacter achroorhodeus]